LRNIEAYPEAHVQVFEQTGRMVFESTGSYQAWDGKFNGNQIPATVYYFIIDLKDGSEVKTGSLTILR
jgi:gliding motility-associated-like protein